VIADCGLRIADCGFRILDLRREQGRTGAKDEGVCAASGSLRGCATQE
jgi:hypothetical protein